MLSESAVAAQDAAASQRTQVQEQLDTGSVNPRGAADATSPWWTPLADTLEFAASFGRLLW